MKVRKSLAALGLSVGLVGGGVAGVVLGVPGIAGAQDGSTTTTQPAGTRARDERPRIQERLATTLAPLVEDGTLTQAQADKVVAALVAAAPDRPPHPPRGARGAMREGLDVAAGVLGMTPRELAEQLRGGQTMAQVAQSKGVDPQQVVDALVADLKSHLDKAVADGRLTQAQADRRLAEGTERIGDRVQNGRPDRGRGDGPPADAPADAPPADGQGG